MLVVIVTARTLIYWYCNLFYSEDRHHPSSHEVQQDDEIAMVDPHTSLTRGITDVRSAAGLGLPLDGLFSGELQLGELDESQIQGLLDYICHTPVSLLTQDPVAVSAGVSSAGVAWPVVPLLGVS